MTMTRAMTYNFNPELTNRIRKYAGAKWYCGKFVRWLLEDDKGNSVKCDQCGNIANAVKTEIQGRYTLNVPICSRHAEELIKEKSGWVWEGFNIYQEKTKETATV